MCQALAAYVLGPGIEAFGSGPDGGREATFDGRAQYLSLTDPWDGFVVLQAKFKERLVGDWDRHDLAPAAGQDRATGMG